MSKMEQRIEGVVETILQDYGCGRDIDKMEAFRQPDKDVVIDIIEKLRRIVFPGYFVDKPIACITRGTTCPCSSRMCLSI